MPQNVIYVVLLWNLFWVNLRHFLRAHRFVFSNFRFIFRKNRFFQITTHYFMNLRQNMAEYSATSNTYTVNKIRFSEKLHVPLIWMKFLSLVHYVESLQKILVTIAYKLWSMDHQKSWKRVFWLWHLGGLYQEEYSVHFQNKSFCKKLNFSKMRQKIKKIETVWLQKVFKVFPKKIWHSYDQNCGLCFILKPLP